MPGCVAKGATSFNHTLTVGSSKGSGHGTGGDGFFTTGDGNTDFFGAKSLGGLRYDMYIYILKQLQVATHPLDN